MIRVSYTAFLDIVFTGFGGSPRSTTWISSGTGPCAVAILALGDIDKRLLSNQDRSNPIWTEDPDRQCAAQILSRAPKPVISVVLWCTATDSRTPPFSSDNLARKTGSGFGFGGVVPGDLIDGALNEEGGN
jgi:hypothetical protein